MSLKKIYLDVTSEALRRQTKMSVNSGISLLDQQMEIHIRKLERLNPEEQNIYQKGLMSSYAKILRKKPSEALCLGCCVQSNNHFLSVAVASARAVAVAGVLLRNNTILMAFKAVLCVVIDLMQYIVLSLRHLLQDIVYWNWTVELLFDMMIGTSVGKDSFLQPLCEIPLTAPVRSVPLTGNPLRAIQLSMLEYNRSGTTAYSFHWKNRLMSLHAHFAGKSLARYQGREDGIWVYFPISIGEKICDIPQDANPQNKEEPVAVHFGEQNSGFQAGMNN
ncbi:hypothetical protein BJ170DRAFT_735881 [Xylariales sp. AK1849]|nr:hypothetical protein BJ170DRAFT_735881 [Xylariales sp. AK1849]